jgi:hypothetical protein
MQTIVQARAVAGDSAGGSGGVGVLPPTWLGPKPATVRPTATVLIKAGADAVVSRVDELTANYTRELIG